MTAKLSAIALLIAFVAAGAWAAPAAKAASAAKSAPAAKSASPVIRFTRYFDRTEGAFFVLVPSGWKTTGGMARLNPLTAQGGVGNATGAKIDFAVDKDGSGKVQIRWLPAINYAQPSPGNSMLGGNWNGMPIVAMPNAVNYLSGILFPALRPRASNVEAIERKQRPDIVASVERLPVAQTMRSIGAFYVADAATLTVRYDEAGVRYREILFVAVEGYSVNGTGLWSNPFTIAARAPDAEFDSYGPIARAVVNSFALNPMWLQGELEGQARRADLVQATLKDISRVDAEIAKSRSDTMSSIQREQYLTLTSQELYVNPKTGRQEIGSGEWKYRWVGSGGEEIYTNNESWNPNLDPSLKVTGFERSPAAKR
jgi:hypothetical protein